MSAPLSRLVEPEVYFSKSMKDLVALIICPLKALQANFGFSLRNRGQKPVLQRALVFFCDRSFTGSEEKLSVNDVFVAKVDLLLCLSRYCVSYKEKDSLGGVRESDIKRTKEDRSIHPS